MYSPSSETDAVPGETPDDREDSAEDALVEDALKATDDVEDELAFDEAALDEAADVLAEELALEELAAAADEDALE